MSDLESRLAQALVERDEAITRLAMVRAELDALKLAMERRGEAAPPIYPAGTHPAAPPPRRYVLADRVWGLARRGLGLLRR